MKVGSIVYATEQGLGYLAKSFYDNDVVDEVLVIRHRRPTMSWYRDAQHICVRDTAAMEAFCRRMDVMLFFETPFHWPLIPFCHNIGVKTALMPMYECMPKEHPRADVTIVPSLLDLEYYPYGIFIPVPVDVPWKLRERALTFVHNSGHGGLKGRNGTAEVVEAIKLVKSDAKFIIRCQDVDRARALPSLRNTTIEAGSIPQSDLYATGDVFLFPEKFNGLSLPLQEAHASGMMVVATDRFPMNTWLPTLPLVKPSGYYKTAISGRCVSFMEAQVDPRDIARMIDDWYGAGITVLSEVGRKWAAENSWEKLKPRYLEVLRCP